MWVRPTVEDRPARRGRQIFDKFADMTTPPLETQNMTTDRVRLVATAKLRDSIELGYFMQVTAGLQDLCMGAGWVPYAHNWGFGQQQVRNDYEARVIRSRYGSDYVMVLAIAAGISGVLLTLSTVVQKLSAAAQNISAKRKLDVETKMLDWDYSRKEDRADVQAARVTAAALEEAYPVTALTIRVAFGDAEPEELDGYPSIVTFDASQDDPEVHSITEARRLVTGIRIVASWHVGLRLDSGQPES